MKSFKSTLAALLLASPLAMMAPAQADPVTVTFQGFSHGSQKVDITKPTNAGSVLAGQFQVLLNGAESLYTFCIDLYQTVSIGGTYTNFTLEEDTGFSDSVLASLGRLYENFYSTIVNSTFSAAFQVAIWEVITGGSFKASGSGQAATAISLGQNWANQAMDPNSSLSTGDWEFLALRSITRQDQLVARPGSPTNEVPLPATLLLMGCGLIGLAAVRRRNTPAA